MSSTLVHGEIWKVSFRQKMGRSSKSMGSNIVLALDPLLDEPNRMLSRSIEILEAVHPFVCAVKINRQLVLPVGLFNEVQKVVSLIHDLGLLAIMDCKINDIGYTNHVIAECYYEAGFDAVIANPFVGWEEGLQPVFEVARQMDRGVILLVYMSHKGAKEGYGQKVHNPKTGKLAPQYLVFAKKALSWAADGAVVGATFPEKIREVHAILGDLVPIYSPGVGAQGGQIQPALEAGARYLIVGRTITSAKDPANAAGRIRDSAQGFSQ